MITVVGSRVSNAVGEEKPGRQIRRETIRVAKAGAQGRHRRTWITEWRMVPFTKNINYYFAKGEEK